MMLSQQRIRLTCASLGLSVVTAVLVAGQVQTAIADDHSIDAKKSAIKMVYCQISIAISGSETDTKVFDQLQLVTLDGAKATVQVGQQVAIPVGTMSLPGNRTVAQNYQRQDVGTIAKVEPKIVGDQIIMSLQIEKSWVEAPNSDTQTDIASRYTTFSASADSTLALQSGKPEVLKVNVAGSPGGQREAMITVLASAKPFTAAKGAVDQVRKSRSSNRSAAPMSRRPSGASRPSGAGSDARDAHSHGAHGHDAHGHDAHGGPSKAGPPKNGPASGRDSRSDSERDRSAGSDSRTGGPSPIWAKNDGARRIFELIDKNKDGIISSTERNGNRLAESMASRGLKFSDKMNPQQFQSAVAKMVKGFRKDRDSKPDSVEDDDQ
ncbi:MAG: hypothetical protein ABJZ55_02910 [Fuerstiella sp.]